jgi:hypothetical protein
MVVEYRAVCRFILSNVNEAMNTTDNILLPSSTYRSSRQSLARKTDADGGELLIPPMVVEYRAVCRFILSNVNEAMNGTLRQCSLRYLGHWRYRLCCCDSLDSEINSASWNSCLLSHHR